MVHMYLISQFNRTVRIWSENFIAWYCPYISETVHKKKYSAHVYMNFKVPKFSAYYKMFNVSVLTLVAVFLPSLFLEVRVWVGTYQVCLICTSLFLLSFHGCYWIKMSVQIMVGFSLAALPYFKILVIVKACL